tara:strand:+ start:317 stop:781 length:465 start_codon:yes stop_codon:yes gene_type:complete
VNWHIDFYNQKCIGHVALITPRNKIPTSEQYYEARACGINGHASYHAEHQMHIKIGKVKTSKFDSWSLRFNYRAVYLAMRDNRDITIKEAHRLDPTIEELACGWRDSRYCTHCALESAKMGFRRGNYIMEGELYRETFDVILEKSDFSSGTKKL